MSLPRRQLLQILSYAFGSSFILPRNEFAMGAQNSAQLASPAPPAKATAKDESRGTKMEKVAGIGGLFFRAHDPKALGSWYQQHLGIALTPTSEAEPFGSKRPDRRSLVPFPKTPSISAIPTSSGWSTFACTTSTKW